MPGFLTCGPNEALIVSGCCHSRPLMVPGGRVFIWPWVQKVQKISLNTLTLTIESPKVYSNLGVPISITGIAQVKIPGSNAEMLKAACEQFLGKTPEEMSEIVKETIEGHQRAIIASMTVEEIYKNRKKFSKKVFEVAAADLVDMGFLIISYTIKDVSDSDGYLKSLGEARTAEVKRDAKIGEAEANKNAAVKEAQAQEQEKVAISESEAQKAKAKRDFDLKKAEFDIEVMTKTASSALAGELQLAKTKQKLREYEMRVEETQRTKAIEIEQQEVLRKQRELESTVKLTYEAEKEKMETLAKAYKTKTQIECEAEAEAIRIKSKASARAIVLKSKADADQLAKKASAFAEYGEAAKVELILDALPKVVAEVCHQWSNCNRITMVSNGPDAQIGAKKMIGEVLDIVTRIADTTQDITGRNYKTGQAVTGRTYRA